MAFDLKFLESLEDISSKIAVVTGGTSGIGRYTATCLAALGASVYVAAPDLPECRDGFDAAVKDLLLLEPKLARGGSIQFHPLDLSDIQGIFHSSQQLRETLRKSGILGIDILVCNAGILGAPLREMSKDGYDKTFAVNCLGHFSWINCLLDLVQHSADETQDARIILTSSEGYAMASKIDYSQLQTKPPGENAGYFDAAAIFQRYCTSKLAILYMAMELDRILRSAGISHIYVNAIHPGRAGQTGIMEIENRLMGVWAIRWFKAIASLGYRLNHSMQDAAKTGIFMAASSRIRDEDIHGQYWVVSTVFRPTSPHWLQYSGSVREELTPLAADESEQRKLWKFCTDAVKNVLGSSCKIVGDQQ